MPERIGFVGLGTMGQPFATNIVEAGFDLVVCDLRHEPVEELRKRGAKTARSARELAEQVDIIHCAVPHEREVDAMLHGNDGLLAGARKGSVLALHSSMYPRNMQAVAEEVESH